MTDNEIIKALELCVTITTTDFSACDKCPYNGKCGEGDDQILKDILDFIKRQRAEIERLNNCVTTEEEVRRIAKETIIPMVAEAKAKAIEEFAKRIHAKADYSFLSRDYTINSQTLRNLVKEMTEETK